MKTKDLTKDDVRGLLDLMSLGGEPFYENLLNSLDSIESFLGVLFLRRYKEIIIEWLSIPYENLPLYINNYKDDTFVDELFKLIVKWRLTICK